MQFEGECRDLLQRQTCTKAQRYVLTSNGLLHNMLPVSFYGLTRTCYLAELMPWYYTVPIHTPNTLSLPYVRRYRAPQSLSTRTEVSYYTIHTFIDLLLTYRSHSFARASIRYLLYISVVVYTH